MSNAGCLVMRKAEEDRFVETVNKFKGRFGELPEA
jgi:hypothetical protein